MKETTKAKIHEGKVVNAYGNQITWICVEGSECQHTLAEDAKNFDQRNTGQAR